jgi:hypothetical protein
MDSHPSDDVCEQDFNFNGNINFKLRLKNVSLITEKSSRAIGRGY